MNHTTSVLQHIADFMSQENVNLRELANKSDINAGTLSSILNKNKILTVHHLDRLTKVMKYPEGHFYEQYIKDHLSQDIPNWRRFKPFLYRCADLDKLDCMKQIVSLLMENLMYSPLLFEVAEDLYQQDKRKAAKLLFENVAISEKQQHSERLAFCQYRLFLIRLGTNQEKNYQAAIQFEPYVERLDELDQLDALKELASTYRSLHRWDKVYTLALRLNNLAKLQYSNAYSSNKKGTYKNPDKPLFYYIVYSNMLIGNVYYEQGNYELSLQFAYDALKLEWVREKDEDALYWKGLFQEWAQANIYLTQLMAGNIEVLNEYVNLIGFKDNEIFMGLWNIMIAANRYKLNVDDILLKFKSTLDNLLEHKKNNIYNEYFTAVQLIGLLFELATYYLFKNNYQKGFRYLLDALKKATIINNESTILLCMRLFERYRNYATQEMKLEYHNLVKVGEENEKAKKHSIVFS